jgi:hypothetical protein
MSDGALDLADKLQQQNLELAGRIGWLQAELQQRDEQLKALQEPAVEPEPARAGQDAVDSPRAERPWWLRLVFSLLVVVVAIVAPMFTVRQPRPGL